MSLLSLCVCVAALVPCVADMGISGKSVYKLREKQIPTWVS